ncbi:XdhC family protein [Arthrobacter alpinus]|nr:XdhC family protein [Arthrobacter alpinus]
MREVLKDLVEAVAAGRTVGLGTVVRTFRSAPRPAGASMMVDAEGLAVGSVSGGCVEGALYELASEVALSGRPVLQRYGISDDAAFEVGLTCGGIIDVFVEAVSHATFPELAQVAADLDADRPVAVVTVIEHPDPAWLGRHLVVHPDGFAGSLGSDRADQAVSDDVMGLLAAGRNTTLMYGPDGERRGDGMRVFVASFAPQPRMLVFGAIDFAAAVARQGSFLGYRVTVCDARAVFATRARFPVADEVVVEWPHRYLQAQIDAGLVDPRTVICVLTHDPKFDVPLLEVALRHEVAYVGAMGSRKTHDDRMERLREAGLTQPELSHLSSPIGLDLGSRTPEETAVSIAAEIIAQRWGGQGRRLSDLLRDTLSDTASDQHVRIHHVPLADAAHEDESDGSPL